MYTHTCLVVALQMKNWECYDEAILADMSGADAYEKIVEEVKTLGIKFDGVFSTHDHQQSLVGQVFS